MAAEYEYIGRYRIWQNGSIFYADRTYTNDIPRTMDWSYSREELRKKIAAHIEKDVQRAD